MFFFLMITYLYKNIILNTSIFFCLQFRTNSTKLSFDASMCKYILTLLTHNKEYLELVYVTANTYYFELSVILLIQYYNKYFFKQ